MRRRTNPIVGMLFFAFLIYVFGDMFLDYPNFNDPVAYFPLVLLGLSIWGFIVFFKGGNNGVDEEKKIEGLSENDKKE